MEQRGAEVVARRLSHSFESGGRQLRVLDDVELRIGAGEYCALQGASGAGKTTLLSLIGGLEPLQQGELTVGGVDLRDLRGDALAEYRRTMVGFVFQDAALLPALTALENVELATVLAGAPVRKRRRWAMELLDAVGLRERAKHRPSQLSGGERQRVAMARALANRPRLLLADEPTGNLDEHSTQAVIELLERLHRQWGCTLLVVTHNEAVARRAARRLLLTRGRVVRAPDDERGLREVVSR